LPYRESNQEITMSIDWLRFSPLSSFTGGLLIGVAACGLILMVGRIAGISGIIGGLLHPRRGEIGWRAAFVAGLIAAPLLYRLAADLPPVRIEAGWLVLVSAGLLVGIGTRYGAGCTSGHGVCGLARLSPRSLAAVGSFMAAGFLTVWLTRHVVVLP
jgi:uncharacterized membrane protein YedE/YeeE